MKIPYCVQKYYKDYEENKQKLLNKNLPWDEYDLEIQKIINMLNEKYEDPLESPDTVRD